MHYVRSEHLGSIHLVTDAAGNVIDERSYGAFGVERNPIDWSDPSPPTSLRSVKRGFTGHDSEDELGLVNMIGRHYDPKIGVFLQPDPIVQAPHFSQSLNRFAYVFNNPLKLIDPSGYTGEGESSSKESPPPSSSGGVVTTPGRNPNSARDANTGEVFTGAPGEVVLNVDTGNPAVNTGTGWAEFAGDGAMDAAELTGALTGAWQAGMGPNASSNAGDAQSGGSQGTSTNPGAPHGDSPGGSTTGGSTGGPSGPSTSGSGSPGTGGGHGEPPMRPRLPPGTTITLDEALIIAALLNGEGPDAIRTDGTGSRLGVPGGLCDSCEGGAVFQGMYLLGTGIGFAGGAAGLKAAEKGAARGAGAGRLLPTLGNLGDDAAGTVIGQLSAGRGGYSVGGQLAEGSFDFVVQEGRVVVGRGHAALAGGGRVTYAGEATFRGGQLVEWTNASGHFRPSPAFAGNSGLPMGAFRPVQFPSFVGGSQLPVFQ